MPKQLALLGSTGSIGASTLEIVAAHPERFRVRSLTAGRNLPKLAEQIRRFRPELVAVVSEADAAELSCLLGDEAPKILHGVEGLTACATLPQVDLVISAIVGAAGLVPTHAAIQAGKDIALANKETLVVAGPLIMAAAAERGVSIFPVDSEHSAIFQSLLGHRKADVRRLILTASGGPFRRHTLDQLRQVSADQALAHPNWTMGRKISIDSATMMNKGLEVIEARWLFDLPAERIDVHIHPQSIVHSMVEYEDGSVIAQMGIPDMKTPIAYALSHPERLPLTLKPLDLCRIGTLTFEHPDPERFSCLALAYRALASGGTAPAVLNAANEIAVEAFLDGRIRFLEIPEVIRLSLDNHQVEFLGDLATALRADAWAREEALRQVALLSGGAD